MLYLFERVDSIRVTSRVVDNKFVEPKMADSE